MFGVRKRTCRGCGCKFEQSLPDDVYCQKKKCQRASKAQRKRKFVRGPNYVPAQTVGAISELLICADLMSHGFEVFRSVSPVGPGDIVAFKNGKYWKIDATTASPGNLYNVQFKGADFSRYDVLAVVFPMGKKTDTAKYHQCIYYPDIIDMTTPDDPEPVESPLDL